MNKDQAKGHIEEAKGKVKEVAGKVVGNESLELKGKVQNIAGKAQAAFGDAKAEAKKACEDK
ncbi:MAG: CsbD-like protein [Proteobacteria bacterium]|nr:CsbD-like protein [Pseudomonadota bacterium]